MKWYLRKLRLLPYCGTVKQVIALVLVLSMLASAQARAVHWYLDHASHSIEGGELLLLTEHDGSDATHATGHCDVCGHAGMVAVEEQPPPFRVFVGIFKQIFVTRESRVGDPPVRRADKPPR